MLKIGITGGIGSGKSTVCDIFRILDIPIFNSDLEARRLMERNEGLIKRIQDNFGKEIYSTDGKINRIKLSALVFADRAKLKILNELVHPYVFAEFDQWLESIKKINTAPFIIKEAALMFESKSHLTNDFTVLVSSPEPLRIIRIKAREGWTLSKIQERMRNQIPEEEKKRLSDYVLYNDSEQWLIPQVLALFRLWSTR